MRVGPSDLQLKNEAENKKHSQQSPAEFRTSLCGLEAPELLSQCVQLHAENATLRSQLAAVALRAEEEDECTVLRLSRQIESMSEEIEKLRLAQKSETTGNR